MFYREDKNFMSEDQKRFLDDIVLGKTHKIEFPWYLSRNMVYDDAVSFLYHTVIKRPENRTEEDEIFNSNTGPFFMELFNQFVERNKIKCKVVYRCCVNLTLPSKGKIDTHTDHEFPYKHFLIYLNDSDGDTCIFNKNGTKIEKRITPEKYKGICFEKRPHYAEFSTKGLRFVVSYTFI